MAWTRRDASEYEISIGDNADWIRFSLSVHKVFGLSRWWAYAVANVGSQYDWQTFGFRIPGPIEGEYWASLEEAQAAAIDAVAAAAVTLLTKAAVATAVAVASPE